MALFSAVPTPTPGPGKEPTLVVTDHDIVFNCPKCQGELVVDREGAGMEVPCSHCGQRLTVPAYQPRPAAVSEAVVPAIPAPAVAAPPVAVAPMAVPVVVAAPPAGPAEAPAAPPVQRTFNHAELSTEQLARRWSELKHQLKENRSQDTEMRGHVNRATIELHRLQLRLKTLQDRHGDITAEIAALQTRLDEGAA